MVDVRREERRRRKGRRIRDSWRNGSGICGDTGCPHLWVRAQAPPGPRQAAPT